MDQDRSGRKARNAPTAQAAARDRAPATPRDPGRRELRGQDRKREAGGSLALAGAQRRLCRGAQALRRPRRSDQVLGGGDPAGPVGRADGRHTGRRCAGRVDDDHRDTEFVELRLLRGRQSLSTSSTPSDRRAASCSSQRRSGRVRLRPCTAETTTPVSARWATSSTPARISIAHGLPRSMNTRSISPTRSRVRARGGL